VESGIIVLFPFPTLFSSFLFSFLVGGIRPVSGSTVLGQKVAGLSAGEGGGGFYAEFIASRRLPLPPFPFPLPFFSPIPFPSSPFPHSGQRVVNGKGKNSRSARDCFLGRKRDPGLPLFPPSLPLFFPLSRRHRRSKRDRLRVIASFCARPRCVFFPLFFFPFSLLALAGGSLENGEHAGPEDRSFPGRLSCLPLFLFPSTRDHGQPVAAPSQAVDLFFFLLPLSLGPGQPEKQGDRDVLHGRMEPQCSSFFFPFPFFFSLPSSYRRGGLLMSCPAG